MIKENIPMNNKTELLEQLIAEGRESEWLEFKENFHDPEEIGICLSSLSNSANLCGKSHGYLVFGVHNGDLDIVGTTFSFKKKKVKKEEYKSWLANRLKPCVEYKVFEFSYKNKQIVILEIEPTYKYAYPF